MIRVWVCGRDGGGGSPTGVVVDAALTADTGEAASDRRRVAAGAGASHTAYVAPAGPDGTHEVRFATAAGDLRACGHGTLAAAFVLGGAHQHDLETDRGGPYRRCLKIMSMRTASGRLEARVETGPGGTVVWATTAAVTLAAAATAVAAEVLEALGLASSDLSGPVVVASAPAPRLLIPLVSPQAVAAVHPDQARLEAVTRPAGLLGCFVHSPAVGTDTAHVVARMFAPAIGVPEDVANANSTGCLGVQLHRSHGIADLVVDQGDALGRPSRVLARTRGTRTEVGGAVRG